RTIATGAKRARRAPPPAVRGVRPAGRRVRRLLPRVDALHLARHRGDRRGPRAPGPRAAGAVARPAAPRIPEPGGHHLPGPLAGLLPQYSMNKRALAGRVTGIAIVAATALVAGWAVYVSQKRPLTDDASVRAD